MSHEYAIWIQRHAKKQGHFSLANMFVSDTWTLQHLVDTYRTLIIVTNALDMLRTLVEQPVKRLI